MAFDAELKVIPITSEEREQFVAHHALPKNNAKAYIWFAFEEHSTDSVRLYADELETAAEMADEAGLVGMASRLRLAATVAE